MARNTSEKGNSTMTALVAILVIAVIAFGVWYVTKMETAEEDTGSSLQVNLGSGDVQ